VGAELQDVSKLSSVEKPIGFNQALAASIMIGECSGTFISRHGHVLTALHCIRPPLSEVLPGSGLTITETAPASNRNWGEQNKQSERFAELMQFDPQSNKMVSSSWSHAHNIVLGKGYGPLTDMVAFAINYPDQLKQVTQEGYLNAGDFVVVDTGMENSPCAPIAETDATPGDSVYSIEYPMRPSYMQIAGRPNWSGLGPSISIAKIVDGMTESLWGQLPALNHVDLSPESSSALRSALNSPQTFYSSLDGFPGSSGSGVFNAKGELVGVLNSLITDMSNGYVPGATGGPSIKHIIDETRNQLSASAFEKVFDCPVR
jgi:V8-like Glu-specific endopeptidase